MKKVLMTAAMVLVLSLIVTMQSGCLAVAAAGAAAGTVMYTQGDLSADVSATADHVVDATKMAMDDLKLPILSSVSTGLEGSVEARVGSDNKATVKIKSKGEKVSHINIRIGTFGDESMSRQILDRIKAHL
jgi:uncharacterized protein YpuA (DUF1002 family)